MILKRAKSLLPRLWRGRLGRYYLSQMKELIAHARANPGKLNYGHPGVGVAPHLIGELLKANTGIDFALIAYKGDAQTVPAMN